MYLLCKVSIDCAHHIEDSDELLTKKCASEHGHTYNFEIAVHHEVLKAFYDVKFVDFALLKEDIVKKILGKYDHTNITKLFEITTAEHFAWCVQRDIVMFYKCKYSDVRIRLFETEKWGVEL